VPVKILAADDSASMRKIMEMTFAGEDAEVVTVDSGEAAVQRAQQFRPDVMFVDLTMGMDGYSVAQAIKGSAEHSQIAVIVMSSQHVAYDEERGRGAGVDDHVVKPFDSTAVIEKVVSVLSRPRAVTTAGGPGPYRAPPAMVAPPPIQKPAARPASTPMTAATAPRPVVGGGPRPAPTARQPIATRPITPQRPAAAPVAAAGMTAGVDGADFARKLGELGLSQDQVAGVLQASRDVVERVVWEVVPDLAEQIIREEIRRLTAD